MFSQDFNATKKKSNDLLQENKFQVAIQIYIKSLSGCKENMVHTWKNLNTILKEKISVATTLLDKN